MTRSSKEAQDAQHDASMRLDKWLWVARFFKTRQLAIEAINGGKVHVNGQRAKPGKEIGTGVRLTITKEPYAWDIEITGLKGQRRPASEALELYVETEASREKRIALVQERKEAREQGIRPEGRPSKRDRRMIHRFKQQSS